MNKSNKTGRSTPVHHLTVVALLTATPSLAEYVAPIYSVYESEHCSQVRDHPELPTCKSPWLKLIEPLEDNSESSSEIFQSGDIVEVWLCNDPLDAPPRVMCFSAERGCGCMGANLGFFSDWSEPVDYTDEVMEHVFTPCSEYAMDIAAVREGVTLTAEQRADLIENNLLPLQKPLIDATIAILNDALNDAVAMRHMGYQMLENRMVLYREFLGNCLQGAVQ